MSNYLIPRFLQDALSANISTLGKINPHLLFYRYLKGSKENENKSDKSLEVLREKFIEDADISMLNDLIKRQEADLIKLKREYKNGDVCGEPLKLVDRMVTGMGIGSSFENGLLLHWIHGIPYINGETLKGAARGYARELLDTNDASQKETFKKIFGTLEKQEKNSEDVQKGKVIFFDALPGPDNNLFDIDIVTCHYIGYYTTEPIPKTPGDWHMPKPVPFLTVRAGVTFNFAVASKDKTLAIKAWDWLKQALIKRGIGAKKHVGYGHFYSVRANSVTETNMEDDTEEIAEVSSSYKSFMEEFNTIKPDKLAGRASDLVNKIGKIEEAADRLQAAHALYESLPKSLKKKSQSDWAKQLIALLEEKSQ